MTTYELRFYDSDSTTENLDWYLQKVVGGSNSTRYPASGYITTSSAVNPTMPAASTYNDIMSGWGEGGSIDLSSLMSMDSGAGLTIKIEDGRRDSVKINNKIESFIIYQDDDTKKKENVIQGGSSATVSFTMDSGDEPYFIMTDGREITGDGQSQPFRRVQMHISAVCVPPFTKIPKIVEIKDVNRGDIIRTSRGDLPIAHIMKTQTGEHKEYVKFEKGCLAPNLPSDDFYVTKPHPLSLGFYKNEVLNNGEYDDKEDDYIMLQMAAGELVDTLPGITKVKRDFGHYYNLVFDEHASIDMEGIDVCSHHPRTGPFFLPRDKYIDSSKIDEKKIDKKITNPKFIRMCDLIIRYKPENVELKEFLASCLTSDLNKKRQLVN